MFWQCSHIQKYWKDIWDFLHIHMGLPHVATPTLSLLGLTEDLPLNTRNRLLLLQLLFFAKKLILLHWKDTQAPQIREWKQLVNSNLPHIKAVYISRNWPTKFDLIWGAWIALDNLTHT
ncbi:hypothetical protein XELAEV_18001725mg [Xenopus laevis]|nr:hypothetical protein XELAEV_18001725mg [Xenopus laevis]